MTGADFAALLPVLISAYVGVVLMVSVALWRSHAAAAALTLAGLAAAFGSIFLALGYAPRAVTPLVQIDHYSLYFTGLLLLGAFLIVLLSPGYLGSRVGSKEAYYVLLMFCVAGMVVTASSAHFVSFFLGLETISVSLYGLIGYPVRHKGSLEAAVKYLVPAATSAAFLLFGIALVYAEFGTMDFTTLIPLLRDHTLGLTTVFGLGMIFVGFGFKLAFVPFHMWSPDVYQGAPAPVTALIASGSKAAVFALLLRLVVIGDLINHAGTFLMLAILAVATMSVGNLLALLQSNVKRLLAYSSVAQIGYLLIPVLAGGLQGHSSFVFYLTAYVATSVAAFGVIAVASSSRPTGDVDDLNDYQGLIRTRPGLAIVFSLALLSLTGIPLTAGFFAKVYIFAAAAEARLWWLLIVGVVNSGAAAFYYLRLLIALYQVPPALHAPELPTPSPLSGTALAVASAIVLAFGIYPTPLIRLAEAAAGGLGF